MIIALHGNVGLPEEMHPLLRVAGGLGASPNLWRALAEHPRTASLEGFGDFLNAIAAPDVARPRVLMGYSLGGRIALHAVTQRPENWDAAVILSAHPGLASEAERAVRLAQDQSWAKRFMDESWPEVIAAWDAQPIFSGSGSRREAVHIPTHQNEPPHVGCYDLMEWRREIARAFDLWSLGRQRNLRPRMRAITCPVLWLTGASDKKFSALAAETSALIPNARHVILAGAGHRVHLDQPAAVTDEIRTFLVRDGC
jgi:2-succinyl-6-hydroxy-2,4-cyclohexadiene-1-carboxylate synthase